MKEDDQIKKPLHSDYGMGSGNKIENKISYPLKIRS